MTDGFEDIMQDHRAVNRLLEQYEREADDGVAREACEELALHVEAEEMVLYPHVRDGSADGDELAERAELEHASVAALIARVFAAPPTDLSDVMAQITDQVRAHVQFEEADLLPRLRQRVDGDVLSREFAEAKHTVQAKNGQPLA